MILRKSADPGDEKSRAPARRPPPEARTASLAPPESPAARLTAGAAPPREAFLSFASACVGESGEISSGGAIARFSGGNRWASLISGERAEKH